MKIATISFYCYGFGYVASAEAMLSVFWEAGMEQSQSCIPETDVWNCAAHIMMKYFRLLQNA
jgi:hypothetical protein